MYLVFFHKDKIYTDSWDTNSTPDLLKSIALCCLIMIIFCFICNALQKKKGVQLFFVFADYMYTCHRAR